MKIGGPPLAPPPRITGLPDRRASRADRFDALGMFGLSRARAAPVDSTEGPLRMQTPAGASKDAAYRRPPDQAEAPLPGRLPCATTSPAKTAQPCLPSATKVGETPSRITSGDIPNRPAPALDPDEEIAPEQIGSDAAPPLRAPARPAAGGLVLYEENGVAEVTAGLSDVDPNTQLALRRIIAQILARSGLVLTQFQLNGAPVAPDFLAKIGGSDGSRSN